MKNGKSSKSPRKAAGPKKSGKIRPPAKNVSGGTGRLKMGGMSSSGTNRLKQVIEEDEYIADINGSVTFATTKYSVNPGQATTFPWAYKLAALYERYTFEFVEFYYKRIVSEFATNGSAGKVILSADFDVVDANPTTKQQVEDTVPHADGMPCDPVIRLNLPIKELNRRSPHFVRPDVQPANTDLRIYDVANLFVSTVGCVNTTAIGELRVRYRCRFEAPILEAVGAQASTAGSSLILRSATAGETGGATNTYFVQFASTSSPVTVSNGIGATIASTGAITLPTGVYLVEAASISVGTTNNISAGAMALCASATVNTNRLYEPSTLSMQTAVSAATIPYGGYNSYGFLWNTALQGTTLSMQVKATYAAGALTNYSLLRITLL